MNILAIDPGNTESAYALIDGACQPHEFAKMHNDDLLDCLRENITIQVDRVAIEMVASYGMAVGAEVFETCVWIGRFAEALRCAGVEVELVKRQPVKLHHCHDSRAKDSNVRQALVDRFAPGEPNHGKGTKAEPGWFHGFRADIWQAYALAVYIADTTRGNQVNLLDTYQCPGCGYDHTETARCDHTEIHCPDCNDEGFCHLCVRERGDR